MIGWKPATTFACGLTIDSRTYDSSATTVAPPWSCTVLPNTPSRLRRLRLRVTAVARRARQVLEQLRAGCGRGVGRVAAAKPRLERIWFHRHDRPDHAGMLRAAVLGAEQVVPARLRRGEPEDVVAPGDDVRLHPERGNEEAVDDVFGAHDQLDRAADRHVQLVDLALPLHVLRLPHPLLADDVDFHRAGRRPVDVEEDLGAPAEHHHGDEERDDRPEQFQHQRAVVRDADLVLVPAAVLDREHRDQRRDEQREECRDGEHEEVDAVDGGRLGRGLLRKKRKVREHR